MPDFLMEDVVKALLQSSEKAAAIARSCCGYSSEALLVAQKGDGEANARFEKDFKTIADVLAQVCAKHEIKKHCRGLVDNVRGEECAEIGGVTIELKETEEKTAELLSTLIPVNAAKRMAKAAHCKIKLSLGDIVPLDFPNISPSDIGVWIDPIDATAEFIAGVNGEAGADEGLSCVTVLIGAYLKSTGEPIFGVINQPFHDKLSSPLGRIVWGLCYGEFRKWGASELQKTLPDSNTFLTSAAETPEVVAQIKELGWDVQSVPGAGHKLMKGTTFRWDTCGPHAILKAQGGEILDYTTMLPLTYNDPDDLEPQAYCNSGGLIAYGADAVFERLKVIFDK
ncbi:Inositol polyphosphate 1-phosphatase [Operophtera brumata]|uniref:Inositol polyphosphate 1-phosphatase n=1 Tax=Operophtera brumata TaxID=104452 RepID=A0A0L7KW22_OPEBR|nr:Inositol polyphosphate 1-phosphatase [Operophtera brumata]